MKTYDQHTYRKTSFVLKKPMFRLLMTLLAMVPFMLFGHITDDNGNPGGYTAACSISSIAFSDQSTCNNNNNADPNDDYYTADITITFSEPPASGLLQLEQSGAVIDVVNIAVGSLVGSTHTFQDVRLKANGMVNAVDPSARRFSPANLRSCSR